MSEEGTLSILRRGHTYQVRYASNYPHGRDRQPFVCPDEATLRAMLHQCGVASEPITQACTELRQGRVAILFVVLSAEQMQTWFPPTTLPP